MKNKRSIVDSRIRKGQHFTKDEYNYEEEEQIKLMYKAVYAERY
jgi:RNA polymerase sigma-70 factor (ECF subfamily)